MLVGYGAVAAFFAVVVIAMEKSRHDGTTLSDYATGGRSFSAWFGTMSFLNTWLAGSVFTAFAGACAGSGVVGLYAISYGLLAVVLMFFLGKPVNRWGEVHDLRTQADLLGLRYNSGAVRIIAACIGTAASIPWIVLGMQSLSLVFSKLSFGRVDAYVALFIGVAFIALRQVWTVRFGTYGLVVSDMVQGLVAYGVGFLAILGMLMWLFQNDHGFDSVAPQLLTLPGPGSELGPLYLFSIIATGATGAWCWPDIFVRLFSVKSPREVQKSALQAAPIMFLFSAALYTMALLASSVPGVSDAPDHVWFTMASVVGGVGLVSIAGVCVVAATMGNAGANLQAVGTQIVNDVIDVVQGRRDDRARSAKVAVAVVTLASAVAAIATAKMTSGLLNVALVSYTAICQLAPTILLGIFWRRGTASAASASMLTGIVVGAAFEIAYPMSIPWLGGLTAGVAGLVVNLVVYVGGSLLYPAGAAERGRVDALFDSLDATESTATVSHLVSDAHPSARRRSLL
ncbi:sodium:solute symporter family protein [Mycolicibacterium brisbanense]|uniref:Na+/solute symporter n=1 Tax=Mycolicibacterium brisbanense TaxID=146020 RepID=A0A117I7K2_9MYCO|nr:sodium:solute symporter family protein [Mycolicibacterium brisbanense]GAS91670.1 Na+/solute symporter [Mycolicibacterium brisbanense]